MKASPFEDLGSGFEETVQGVDKVEGLGFVKLPKVGEPLRMNRRFPSDPLRHCEQVQKVAFGIGVKLLCKRSQWPHQV